MTSLLCKRVMVVGKTNEIKSLQNIPNVVQKKRVITQSSKSSFELVHMLKGSIDKANTVCSDMAHVDDVCMIHWDEVEDLTAAYYKALDKEKIDKDSIEVETILPLKNEL